MTVGFTVPLLRGRDPRAALADGGRSPADERELRGRIQEACRLASPGLVPTGEPVTLTLKIFRPDAPAAGADPWPLAGLVLEALTGLLYQTPGQVVSLRCLRRRAETEALYVGAGEVRP